MDNRFCGDCGAPLEENSRFCGQCGAKVEDNTARWAGQIERFLGDFHAGKLGCLSAYVVSGRVLTSEKMAYTTVHSHGNHIGSRVHKTQQMFVELDNGQEIPLTAGTHIPFRAGNTVLLAYVSRCGQRPVVNGFPIIVMNYNTKQHVIWSYPKDIFGIKPKSWFIGAVISFCSIPLTTVIGVFAGGYLLWKWRSTLKQRLLVAERLAQMVVAQ
ncbi:zinc ribbon domain-containing protein (plasmid) [Acidithiobacillus caldus]|uniref:Zinc-ribbon domain-containing protein n=1 Tax=Acidithiobacillus caldus (strain SM-1) TaxID=990288 RepID=F9ZU67_ACICS|nr:zinc ribbon domain-containing protein [Acidithiobacillus caldus]AEK59686.1 hypothetical protein Atc_m155 [Acidithiobacillus caldus SM-1]AUW34189.1 zinc ribbon domain-containing protein [Acidithiobacillus caldus]QER43349.1 hypothetical protein F0726_00260 [Acidithiobacillus caldus]